MMAVMAMMMTVAQAQGPAKVPAYRGLIERVQPNGDTLRTYLRGDEHKHWMMTEDGWQIRETESGWYKYVQKTCKNDKKTSKRKAHNAENRSKCEKKWLKKHGVKLEI